MRHTYLEHPKRLLWSYFYLSLKDQRDLVIFRSPAEIVLLWALIVLYHDAGHPQSGMSRFGIYVLLTHGSQFNANKKPVTSSRVVCV